MKRVHYFGFAVAILLLLTSSPVSALLMTLEPSPGEFVVWDDLNNKQWVPDLTLFTYMTYAEQIAEIDQLNTDSLAGATGWHMASSDEMWGLFAQVSSLADAQNFTQTQTGLDGSIHWEGRDDWVMGGSSSDPLRELGILAWSPPDATGPGGLVKTNDHVYDSSVRTDHGAWVVRDVAPVPEPSLMLLLGFGLLGLVGFGRKFKK